MGLVEDLLHEKIGRGLIPIHADRDRPEGGTAFLFNHLVESRSELGEPDRVFRFLVTHAALVRGSLIATTTTPRAMVTTPAASDFIAWDQWSHQWHFSRNVPVALAFHPFYELQEHARRKGWKWETTAVTDGMVPKSQFSIARDMTAAIGFEPWELPNPNAVPSVRPVVAEPIGGSTTLGVRGLPASYCGAPVFGFEPFGEGRLRLILLGVVAGTVDGEGSNARALVMGGALRNAAADVYEALVAGNSWRGGD